MKKQFFICIVMTFSFWSLIFAQKSIITSADINYSNYAYNNAIHTYEFLYARGHRSADILEKLGNAYYFNADYENAAQSYAKLYELQASLEPEYYYRYAQSLLSIGKDIEAEEVFTKFEEKANNDSRVKGIKNITNNLKNIRAKVGIYTIVNAEINSEYSDYGSALVEDELVFSSARDTGGVFQRKHTWTGGHFSNLYSAVIDGDLKPSKPKRFDSNVNSKFHESTPVFTKDGSTMFFTRNNYLKGKKGKNTKKMTLLKIYKASWVKKRWTNFTELPFNSNHFNTAHPALSPDEETLYFASDRPGTFGQSDLFKVAIYSNGNYGPPVNLGPTINTEGRETFPFVAKDNQLYFASDGHPGLGGLDIFSTKIHKGGIFIEVENEGAEVNSSKDDFGYFRDTETNKGFFTSNRSGGVGSDDIYRFTRKSFCKQLLKGRITGNVNGEILPGVTVTLFDNYYKEILTTTSDSQGIYSFDVECRRTYSVRAFIDGYNINEKSIKISSSSGKTTNDIQLQSTAFNVTIGDNLADVFGIKMIFFDLNKSDIRSEAALDLKKILDVLQQYPTMKLDIRSHTDCRYTEIYNLAISERRAQATINWLVSNGIDKSRLSGKGYGESKPIFYCECDNYKSTKCTEEQHQMNRRSEFIITAI